MEYVGDTTWNMWEMQHEICGRCNMELVGDASWNILMMQHGICG